MRKPGGRREPVTIITEAAFSHSDQLRSRQRRYLAMMGARALCLVAAAVSYSLHAMWAVPILIVGMVALPWMAVLIANDRPPITPSRFRRRQLRVEDAVALDRRAETPPGRALEAPAPGRVIDQQGP